LKDVRKKHKINLHDYNLVITGVYMQKSIELFHSIIQQIPEINLFVLDKNFNYVLCSNRHKETIKKLYNQEVNVHDNIFNLIDKDKDKIVLKELLDKVFNGEFTTHQDYYETDEQHIIYYKLVCQPLFVEENIVGAICAIHNLTKEKKESVELEDVRHYLTLFSKLAQEGLFYAELEEPVDWVNATNKEEMIDFMLENEFVKYANNAMLNQLNATQDQIVGKNIKTLFDYPIKNVKRDFRKLLNNNEITLVTLEKTFNNEEIWIEGHYITAFDDDNRIIGHFGSRRDITKRVEAQEALEHSHELMKYIIEHNRSSIAVFDKNMNYVYVSQKFIDVYNIQGENIIGKNHYEMFPSTPERIKAVHARAMNGEVLSSDDEVFVRPDGVAENTRWECRPWYAINNEVGGIVLYTEITTKAKQQEKIIKENQQLLKTLLSQAAVGICYGPINNEFKQVNEKLCKILGYTQKQLSNLSIESLVYKEDLDKLKSKKNKMIGDGLDDFTMEIRFLKYDQSIIWANVTFSKIEMETLTIPYIMIVVEDITERKQIEKEMHYLNYHDQLTGVYNRRFYEEELRRLDTKRNLPISLVVADANGLKLINDAFGHMHGDTMIKEIASIIKGECRADDIVARIGGDEFVVLLLKTNKDKAQLIVDRIHQRLAALSVQNAPISISAGISTKTLEHQSMIDVFSDAEANMCRRKLNFRSKTMNETIQIILDTFFNTHVTEKEHATRVSEMSYEMGKLMHFEVNQLNKLKMAGLMHDIGKVNIPVSILNKVSDLSKVEWDEIMKHTEVGYRILSAVNEFAEISEHVLAHHERWDGKGYPKGLSKEEIPLAARIIAVVDAFDTIVHDQAYSGAKTIDEAIDELHKQSNKQFDPYVVEVFIQNRVYDAINY